MIEVDVAVLSFLIGTIIPLITGLVTKLEASSTVKSIVNLILSVIAGGASYLIQNDGSGRWMELVTAMVAVFLASGVSYNNLWKPTGTSVKVQNMMPETGIGKPTYTDIYSKKDSMS